MNLLTKLFIVLLVVCSLLMTAAQVIFVSRTENYKKTAEDVKVLLDQKTDENNKIKAQAETEKAIAIKERDEFSKQAGEERKVAEAARTAQAKAEADAKQAMDTVADAKKSVDAAEKNVQMLVEAVKLKEADLADVRGKYDAVLKREGDLNIAVSKLLKEVDWAKKQLAVKEEQLIESQEMLAKAKDYIKSKGLVFDPTAPIQAPVRLEAKIEDVYPVPAGFSAKISLGTDAQVQKGMKFIISDETGKFMAELVIDEVEPNQAVGRLNGPFAKDVKRGMKAISTT